MCAECPTPPTKARRTRQDSALADEPDDPAPASSRKGKGRKTTAASVEPRESARLKESSKPARKAAAEKEANLQKELKEMKKRCKALEKQAKVQRQNEDDDVQMDSEEETSRPLELFTSSISVKPAVMARKPPQLDLSRPPPRSVKAVAPTPMRRIDILSVINNTVLEDDAPASNAAPLPALEDEEEEAASDELEAIAQGVSASPESANDNRVQVPRPQGAVPSARIAPRSAPTPRPSSAMISVPIQPQYKAGVSLKERPKLGHYDGITLSIAQAAENEYEVLCLAKTAFPSTASRASMARNVWDGACCRFDVRIAMDTRLLRVIVKGGSRIRGLAITAVRKRVFSEYKFVESAIPDVIVANVKIVANLTVNFNYMYKDPTTREGCCIVNIMHLILKDILFGSGRTSIGVVYKKYFCPVPVPLLGLIFCMIKCCLDEWRTGKCIEKAFSEVAVVDKTNDLAEHVKRVEDWAALDAELTTKFRTMWYNQACKLAGIPQDTDRVAIRGLSPDDQERARAELLQHLADMDEE
ncbi:hypothetical protein GGF50DRAFT_117425 [Schizophyllum commune]